MIFLCPWFGTIPQRNLDCINESRASIEAAGHEFALAVQPAVKGGERGAAIAKDLMVLELARFCPNHAFLDGDLIVKSIPALDPGQPYFIVEWDTPRIGYFIVNGCCQAFDALQAEKERRRIKDCYGFPNKLLFRKRFGVIPRETYEHRRYTSGF